MYHVGKKKMPPRKTICTLINEIQTPIIVIELHLKLTINFIEPV